MGTPGPPRRRRWPRTIRVCVALLLVASTLAAVASPGPECPKCGAPLEPGALFCTRCGHRLEGPAPGAPPAEAISDAGASIVQVIATHDKDMSSAVGAIFMGENIRVGTMVGTAFAIAPGEFVTDSGLVSGSQELSVRVGSGRTTSARVKGIDALVGVAWIVADLPDVPVLRLRTGGLPRLGETLLARGFPSARSAARSASSSGGVVSGLHRGGAGIHPIEDYIQTDASLPDGFAGGPVLDADGQVVGISTALLVGPKLMMGVAGIGRVIPSGWIEKSLEWIRAGSPARPWMGAVTVAPDAEMRRMYGLPDDTRTMVDLILPGSPAETAGLRRGDGLVSIQNFDPKDAVTVHSALLAARPGEAWTCHIARRAERLRLMVTLAARPDRIRPGALDTLRYFGGLEVSSKEPYGLVVTRVRAGSEAGSAEVKVGDILTALLIKKDWAQAQKDDARWRPVRDLQDLEKLIPLSYADLDFFLGLRLKSSDGKKHDLYLYSLLSAFNAF